MQKYVFLSLEYMLKKCYNVSYAFTFASHFLNQPAVSHIAVHCFKFLNDLYNIFLQFMYFYDTAFMNYIYYCCYLFSYHSFSLVLLLLNQW